MIRAFAYRGQAIGRGSRSRGFPALTFMTSSTTASRRLWDGDRDGLPSRVLAKSIIAVAWIPICVEEASGI